MHRLVRSNLDRIALGLVILLPLLSLFSYATLNPYYNPIKPHHRPDGFVNSDGSVISKPLGDLFRWYLERFGKSLPPPPGEFIASYEAFPIQPFSASDIQDHQRSASWLGHATVLVKSNGLTVLTDPHFSERAFFVQWAGPARKVPSPTGVEKLPQLDLVLISHNHYDHLDKNSIIQIAELQPNTLFLVPLGVEKLFKSWGVENVQALDWWETLEIKNSEIIFVPAHHWSARTLLDRNTTLWGGWVVKQSDFRFYFSGDTGYNTHDFSEIGRRYGPFDLSAIAVGAYEPRWFMKTQHINPEEAVLIHQDVKSKKSIGVHWGTFELTNEPIDQPIGDLQKAKAKRGIAKDQFVLLEHGQTLALPSNQN